MSDPPEFHLFLPQMRMTLPAMAQRARAAERSGFAGIALMDHLAPPMALDQPMYEAMTTAMYLALQTTTLTVSHLVLCDAFRHPALLAKEAVTIDHASNGRFELGIGWGSVPDEFVTYGVGETRDAVRVARLGETLDVITRLWRGETVDFDGTFHTMHAAQQMPLPTREIPIVIGGAGPKTMALVAEYAHWWNLPIHRLDRLERLYPERGNARASIQQMVAFVPNEAQREEIETLAMRRFGVMGVQVGNADELLDYFGGLHAQGIERFYIWFSDFAAPDTVEAFGEHLIPLTR